MTEHRAFAALGYALSAANLLAVSSNLRFFGVTVSRLTGTKNPASCNTNPLADISMETLYTTIITLTIGLSLIWQFLRLTRMSSRKIISDITLKPLLNSLNWKSFLLPTLSLGFGLYPPISSLLISLGVILAIFTVIDWLLNQKYKYVSYSICGSTLVQNYFNLNEFDLRELTIVNFLPFHDSFKLKFRDGKSVSIHRHDFDKESLVLFLKTAIEKSKSVVVISEDAKSKIYVP